MKVFYFLTAALVAREVSSQRYIFGHTSNQRSSSGYGNPNVRFGYQNPIRAAPTLPPAYDESAESDSKPCKAKSYAYGKSLREERKTGQCFEVGSQGPCGEGRNLAFYEDPTNNQYGECDCARHQTRPLVYHPPTDTCYFIYQQAYCNDKEWLAFDGKANPVCEPNPCASFFDDAKLEGWNWKSNTNEYVNRFFTTGLVPDKNLKQCVAMGSTCSGQKGQTHPYAYPSIPNAIEHAKRQRIQVFTFRQGELEPRCQVPQDPIVPTDFNGLLQIRCRPGSKPRITRQCTYVT